LENWEELNPLNSPNSFPYLPKFSTQAQSGKEFKPIKFGPPKKVGQIKEPVKENHPGSLENRERIKPFGI